MNAYDLPIPQAIASEQSVLGSLLLSPDSYDRIVSVLDAGMFFRLGHGLVYRQIAEMIGARRVVDVVTVAQALEDHGKLDEVGGLSYLASLAQNAPSAANIRAYASQVREKWQARQLMAAGDEIHQLAKGPIGPALDRAQSLVLAIAEARQEKEPQRISASLTALIEQIEAAFESGTGLVGVPTGLADLDEKLGGLRGGQLIIVAGRPAMGKTTLALQIANHAATMGTASLVLSMEMPAIELAAREVARAGKLSAANMMRGKLRDDDWAALTHGMASLQDLPLWVDDQGALGLGEVAAKARTMRRKHGLGLLVIDYLQLMRGEGDNRNQELGSITRGLKALSKELDIPIIVLSQLNRKCEERTNKRPVNSDLRESGDIEQDADVILFIYRDEVYNPDSPDKGTAEIIIGKQRNGPGGAIRTVFDGASTRFLDFAGEHFPARETTTKKPGGWRGL